MATEVEGCEAVVANGEFLGRCTAEVSGDGYCKSAVSETYWDVG
jgi:hypothetical protein